jgi:hypothetical protein
MDDILGYPAAPIVRSVYGIFCEDIRDEVGGTASYIGVFQQALKVTTTYPLMLSKFAAVFWLTFPIGDALDNFDRLFMEMPGGQVVDLPPMPLPPQAKTEQNPNHTRWTVTGTIRGAGFTIQQPGILRLKIKCWGQIWNAASLEFLPPENPGAPIIEGSTVPAIASEQPSGQSPSVAPETKPRRGRVRRANRQTEQTPGQE